MEIVLNRMNETVRSSEEVGDVEAVRGPSVGKVHVHVTHERGDFQFLVPAVDRNEHHAIGTSLVADVVVGSEKQDVDHRIVMVKTVDLNGIVIGSLHFRGAELSGRFGRFDIDGVG